MRHTLFMLCISLVILFICEGNGERTKDKMYQKIDGVGTCIRRLNATHQTGCTSDQSGSTGIIHLVESDADLDMILKTGTAPPYIPVMPINLLTHPMLAKLKNHHEQISGVIIHKNVSTPTHFSNEAKCPNDQYGLEGSCDANQPWNPDGTGLLHEDYPFPIFLVSDLSNIEKIHDCFEKFNNFDFESHHLRSLCALELSSFMFATVNSQTCMRRSKSVINFTPPNFCDPLGDRNVWFTLFPWENTTQRVSDVVLVSARMDTTSFFNDLSPGAVSPVTGLVTILAAAQLLKNMVADVHSYKTNVFFVLFNGESYDYIGSQRFVYDIMNNRFPMERDDAIKHQVPHLKLSDITMMVELGQLGQGAPLYVHNANYKNPESLNKINIVKESLANYGTAVNTSIRNASTSGKLPPASLQSFLIESENIPGIFLTDHDKQFTNHYYNSIYDDKDHIQYTYMNITEETVDAEASDSIQAHIARVSTALARTLYVQVTGVEYTGKETARVDTVDELMYCYLQTGNCKINKAITLKKYIDVKPFSFYVGVVASGNIITTLIGLTVSWLMGTVTNLTETQCISDPHNPVYQYFWMSKDLDDMNSTACFQTTMNFTLAISPAFDIPNYDWHSGKYSTWTESVWRDLSVRMYLKPSTRHEIMTVSVGTITMVLSLAIVYFVKSRSDVLFPRDASPQTGTRC